MLYTHTWKVGSPECGSVGASMHKGGWVGLVALQGVVDACMLMTVVAAGVGVVSVCSAQESRVGGMGDYIGWAWRKKSNVLMGACS